MKATRFEISSEIEADAEALWAFHLSPDALEQLSPKLMNLRIVDPGNGITDGSLVQAEVGPWPLRIQWHALHCSVEANRGFVDIALRSPFRYWVHQHTIEPLSPTRSRLRDVIWLLPPAWIPGTLAKPLVKLGLRFLFAWRHRRTRHAVAPKNPRGTSTSHNQTVPAL